MYKVFGYGEDAFTLWALKSHISDILARFHDQTDASDCFTFYRPSFGRGSRNNRAEFGEFDAILASLENVYLIESKWDNLSRFRNDKILIKKEQTLRHDIFSWYITHWDRKYSSDWASFKKAYTKEFQKRFQEKRIPSDSLLATNLQFVLNRLRKHCGDISSEHNVKNVLLFFYDGKRSRLPTKISKGFNLVDIDYGEATTGNFVVIDSGMTDNPT